MFHLSVGSFAIKAVQSICIPAIFVFSLFTYVHNHSDTIYDTVPAPFENEPIPPSDTFDTTPLPDNDTSLIPDTSDTTNREPIPAESSNTDSSSFNIEESLYKEFADSVSGMILSVDTIITDTNSADIQLVLQVFERDTIEHMKTHTSPRHFID
jgi:hypothetical protein